MQLLALMFLSECKAFALVPQLAPRLAPQLVPQLANPQQRLRPLDTIARTASCHQRSALVMSPTRLISSNTRSYDRGGCRLQAQPSKSNSDSDESYSNADAGSGAELTSDADWFTQTSDSLHISRKLFHTCGPLLHIETFPTPNPMLREEVILTHTSSRTLTLPHSRIEPYACLTSAAFILLR
eukprot:249489-Rhodomonas_salina.1